MLRHLCSVIAALFVISSVHGQDATQIQGFIDEAIKAGRGQVTVPPGTYVLPRGLMLKDAKQIAIIGMSREGCILKLPPLAFAECGKDTPAGATEIPTAKAQHISPAMRLWIEAPGPMDKFTKKPRNYHLAKVKAVEEGKLILAEPLQFPVPVKTMIRDADAANLIEIRGASEDILLRNVTLDGGRAEGDPPVRGHAQLCGVFAAGAYDYEKGPTGPKVKGIAIEDCIIQNFFGRGVALYSVEGARVARCTIMDTNDEAVDFDHFTTNAEARGNRIARCNVAFELNDANDVVITGNEVRDCVIGVNLWRWCKQAGLNEGNKIVDNEFLNTAGNAVQLGTGTRKNVVENNDITGAGKNGVVAGGEEQTVKENRIEGVKGKAVVE
jgi:hypothetical protein